MTKTHQSSMHRSNNNFLSLKTCILEVNNSRFLIFYKLRINIKLNIINKYTIYVSFVIWPKLIESHSQLYQKTADNNAKCSLGCDLQHPIMHVIVKFTAPFDICFRKAQCDEFIRTGISHKFTWLFELN